MDRRLPPVSPSVSPLGMVSTTVGSAGSIGTMVGLVGGVDTMVGFVGTVSAGEDRPGEARGCSVGVLGTEGSMATVVTVSVGRG